MKKILGILLIICIAITCLGIASAAEVTVSDVKFNIPDGYEEVAKENNDAGNGLTIESRTYANGDKNISVGVMTLSGNAIDVSANFDDAVEKVIKNKNGNYSASKHAFEYKDGKKVIIIQDNDEKFEDIIV